MRDIIKTYLLNPNFKQKKVVLIIDANVGMTARDESMFAELKKAHKNIVIVASKTDKMTQSEYHKKISELQEMAGNYPVFPVSSTEKTGLDPLTEELLAE
jgi:GTP-binding protein EngB required for normal cell division